MSADESEKPSCCGDSVVASKCHLGCIHMGLYPMVDEAAFVVKFRVDR